MCSRLCEQAPLVSALLVRPSRISHKQSNTGNPVNNATLLTSHAQTPPSLFPTKPYIIINGTNSSTPTTRGLKEKCLQPLLSGPLGWPWFWLQGSIQSGMSCNSGLHNYCESDGRERSRVGRVWSRLWRRRGRFTLSCKVLCMFIGTFMGERWVPCHIVIDNQAEWHCRRVSRPLNIASCCLSTGWWRSLPSKLILKQNFCAMSLKRHSIFF